MSYALKYTIPFLNREQDSCLINISAKDYVGDSTTFKGAERPFVLSSQAQDNQIPYGICATEAVIEFYTGGLITLNDLYNEDDTYWLVQYYYRNAITWTGYLQLDNSQARITDQDYILSLNANDGLGRLQNLYFLNPDGTPINVNQTLAVTLSYIFAFLPQLFIKGWLNIFENSTQDRDYLNYETFIPQTAFSTKYFINDDGTTQSLYDALNNIMTAFRCSLRQTGGVWQIIRWGDVRLWADGDMPGTLYEGFTGTYSEIFFPISIDVGRGLQRHPINENQIQRILRPFQFSKETFNYDQPPLIQQANLQIDKDAIPFATNTIGDFRYDDYLLATYFLDWKHINSDGSYLEIVTDTSATPETEVDRYIVTPCCTPDRSAVEVGRIPVTAGDKVDFTINWRTDSDTDDQLQFYMGIILITQTDYYMLTNGILITNFSPVWSPPIAIAGYADGDGLSDCFQKINDPSSVDTTQWSTFTLSSYLDGQQVMPPIPADGILLIQVAGTNGNVAINTQGTYWKDLDVTISSFVNSSIQITGQFHNNSQDAEIRNNDQYDVVFDDSPRNPISGTLFTDAITTFAASIGGVFFTRTSAWHRQGVAEARRLGDLNTFNDLFIQRKTRTIVEGDFFGLHDIDLLSIINLTNFPLKKFIFGTASFDYMNCIWNATLYELYEGGETDGDLDNTYLFNYIYENG